MGVVHIGADVLLAEDASSRWLALADQNFAPNPDIHVTVRGERVLTNGRARVRLSG